MTGLVVFLGQVLFLGILKNNKLFVGPRLKPRFGPLGMLISPWSGVGSLVGRRLAAPSGFGVKHLVASANGYVHT